MNPPSPWPAIRQSLGPANMAFRRRINKMLHEGVNEHAFLPSIGLTLGEICIFLCLSDHG